MSLVVVVRVPPGTQTTLVKNHNIKCGIIVQFRRFETCAVSISGTLDWFHFEVIFTSQ